MLLSRQRETASREPEKGNGGEPHPHLHQALNLKYIVILQEPAHIVLNTVNCVRFRSFKNLEQKGRAKEIHDITGYAGLFGCCAMGLLVAFGEAQ